ncbi:MAG: glucose 1-dehydrogenase [Colwellia sp.]|nr:glucose 1-dehydrogenase [Colwellia sp.]
MAMNNFKLSGLTALITGGGSGIGRATAIAFANAGAKVAITELPGRTHLANTVVNELHNKGSQAIAITLDVKAAFAVEDAVEKVADHFGQLDILVNNAGIQILKSALEIEEWEFDEVLNINLKGAFMCAQAAGRIMVDQGRGTIINVASQHGVVGNKLRAPYCASKGGLINLTRALAVEWAEHNIRVNSISPTFVENEHNKEILASDELQNEIRQGVLTGRAATPDDIASGILYLASPAAQMITGHNLMLDGGWTAK